MVFRRPLLLVCLVAALHGLLFIWYQRPDWNTAWSDQDGYRRLGQVLAETGMFTRAPDAPRFVPEVIRTPAYPAFLAALYRVFGVGQLPVALAQTALFVLICVLSYAIARATVPAMTERLAIVAAAATALFPPIPYFGALVMTEVWTTALFTLSMWAVLRAYRGDRPSAFACAGFLLGVTALSRPVFVLFAPALAGIGLIVLPAFRMGTRPARGRWWVMLAVFGITMLPWFMYNYVTLGRFTLSPAGGFGRGLWEGSWQATWSGRLQNELTHIAEDVDGRAELDRAIELVAAREHLPAAPMLEYVHQWQDIRRIWTAPIDPYERAMSRAKADREYQRVALENLRQDSLAHLARRLARGVFLLWAGEIPFRYSDINRLPALVIRLCWLIQALIFAAAVVGVLALGRASPSAAWLLAAPIIYVTAVHFLLFTEARQSLPAQPVLLVLATLGTARLATRRSRDALFAVEPQVHEGQHL
jgi:4-amino-4-deoxy-L-arabinose transferase-like glycosyltransferase